MSRLLACFILFLAAPVLGHGDAAWIMADPNTRWCCGPGDCFPLHSVQSTRAGWAFAHPQTGELVTVPYSFTNRYPSIDEHFWACFNPSGAVRCFFVSPDGV